MATIGSLMVKIGAHVGDLQKGLKDAGDQVSGFKNRVGKLLGGVGTVALGGLAIGATAGIAALGGLTAVTVDFVGEAMAAQEVQAQLNAVLESTKGAAGVSAQLVNNLASEYQNLTRFEDDAIVAGESMLLTFTKVGIDVFPEATAAMLDMSQAMGQDLQQSAIMLGKALNDPVQGVGALRRVGVTFTEDQEKMIASLVETGRMADAQRIILKELQTEFGGSAVAAGETFAGRLDILKNKLGDVKETLGAALIPALTRLAEQFISKMNTPEFQDALDQVATFISEEAMPKIEEFVNWLASEGATKIGEFATWFRDEGLPAIQDFGNWFMAEGLPAIKSFLDTVSSGIETIGKIIDKINEAITTAGQLIEILKRVGVGEGLGRIGAGIGGALAPGTGGPSAIEQAAGGVPGYASGGTVPGPAGQPQLAMVHGGEQITPPGGNNQPQIIQLVVDGRILAEIVSGYQGRQARQLMQMGGVPAL